MGMIGGCALLGLTAMRVTAQAPRAASDAIPERVEFNRDIRPILSDKCFQCHGPGTRAAGLRFDTEEGARRELRGGRHAIVPGDPAGSALLARVTATNPAIRMPRAEGGRAAGTPLTEREVALLTRWIEQGAAWQKHWAFMPPTRPAVPVVNTPGWVRTPIDAFVLQRLEREGLKPSPEADKPTLLRRVTLDLTGLPPTLAELNAFLADRSPNAYEKVVDRLLQAPRYGERMAFPWLDAARYADSNGYQTDGVRYMWRWRDWVIDAFNRNMPYDQFVIEQIAGDLLPNATRDQKIATGFNRNTRGNAEGGIVPEEYRIEYLFDRVDTAGTVFLGLSVGCAKCHDHKFDPISQKDYYRIAAYFNNIPEHGKARRVGNSPPYIEAPTAEQLPRIRRLADDAAAARRRWEQMQPAVPSAQEAWERSLKPSPAVFGGPARGLVAHYPFDGTLDAKVFVEEPEPPGTRGRRRPPAAVDVNRVDPKLVEGVRGQAASFDGTSDVENTADLAGFKAYGAGFSGTVDIIDRNDPGAHATVTYDDAHTFAAWVYATAPTGSIVTRDDNLDEPNGYGLKLRDAKIQYDNVTKWNDESIQVETKQTIPLNEWHHVAVTYSGSRWAEGVRIYLDGQELESKVLFDDLNALAGSMTREPLRIGAGGGPSNRFRGFIDDARVYNRALSADEIRMLAVRESIQEIAAIPEARRSPAQAAAIREYFLDHAAPADIQQARARVFETERARFLYHKNEVPTVMVMEEAPTPRPMHVLIRGLYDRPGERVTPGVPEALLWPNAETYEPNRLGFATWLVDPANPLTARVVVNRFWQQYFGTGIVETAEDFGSQGSLPSHPELLDWLATEFVRTGWNVKALQKLIVMSATYRQSSRSTDALLERDPKNVLLARGPNIRLSAEMIRDQALAIAGILTEKIGGPSVMPYQPEGLWSEVVGSATYEQDHGPNLYRRSLYTFWKRTIPPPTMANFDASTRESHVVRPALTNTPLQALDLMNNVTYLEAARVLAQRMMRQGGAAPRDRIAYGYKLATVRSPLPQESTVLVKALQAAQAKFKSSPENARKFVASTGEWPLDKTLDVSDLAAYTHVASLILNLNRTVMKD